MNESGTINESASKQLKNVRPDKGKSLITFPDSYTIIDLETTGLSPSFDSIIEMSALKIRNGNVVDRFSSLTGADGYIYIDEFITSLTGITQEMIDNAPKINDVLPLYLDFIGEDIIMGHNVHFDINFLYDASIQILNFPLKNNLVDTMRLSKNFYHGEPHHRLIDLAYRFRLDYTHAHRALSDCEITYKVYQNIKDDIIKSFGSLDIFLNDLSKSRPQLKAKDITASNLNFDEDHMLFNKVCVFTGALEIMTRKDAMQIVANFGGINADNVTRETNYLILGDSNYCSFLKDGKSSKHKKAEKLKLAGQDIEIIPENVFYDMINISLC